MFWCFLGLTLLLWSSLTGLEKAFWWTKPHPPPRSHKVVSWKAFRAEGGFLNAFPDWNFRRTDKCWQQQTTLTVMVLPYTETHTPCCWDLEVYRRLSRWVDIPCRVTGVPSTNCFLASFTCYIFMKNWSSDLKLTMTRLCEIVKQNVWCRHPCHPTLHMLTRCSSCPLKFKKSIFFLGLWNGYNLRNCCCFLIA